MGEINNILQINDLSGGYRSFSLQDINFSVQKGVFAGIIGPNGSGKSTLLKMILGVLKPSHGSIVYNNQDLTTMHTSLRAKSIAVVNQRIADTSMSVMEYVMLGRIPFRSKFQFFEKKEDTLKAEKHLEMTGILKYRNSPLSSLSGGEQQLAAMARALTQEPQLLLLDEPTSMLDISHQVQILDMVKSLNKEIGVTVLMIIHDLNLASSYCNQLLLMNEGRLHINGTPQEVLNYQIIEDVFKTVVVTSENPITGKPTVFLVPSDKLWKLER
jgi:iron complex transport system ATP-binding protein